MYNKQLWYRKQHLIRTGSSQFYGEQRMIITRKLISAKRHFYFTVVALLVLGLLSSSIAQATVPIPTGFQLVSQGTGVKVYKKLNPYGAYDYVTVVDLRRATMMSFTGWAYNTPDSGIVERRTLKTHWNNAVAQNTAYRTAKVAINGTFFDPNASPNTPIAFGLKANWWRMSYGYAVGHEYPGLVRTLAYDSTYGSSSIQAYNRSTFDGGIPDVVGGLDPTADKAKTVAQQRTFVGVRDDNGDGNSETVIFYSTTAAPQFWAVQILNGFGAGSKMMLDGGGSTGLIVDGSSYISTSRPLPQVFIIYSGK
jgi:hypothetical protein